jgi:hypothetical protein
MWKELALQHHITSLRGKAWSHKNSLDPPHCIEVPVPSQESERVGGFDMYDFDI